MLHSSTKDKALLVLRQQLISQLGAFAEEIRQNNNANLESGLLDGKAGILLMFSYLSKIFPESSYQETTFKLLEELSNALANEKLTYSMSSGVAGISFAFQHLRNIGVLDASEDLNLSELDEFISQGIDNDFLSGNWDPLHGMVGLGIYFLERDKETSEKKYLEKIVNHLSAMRVSKEENRIWMTPGYRKYSNDNYNFGMAHGMPGILSFLSEVHERGIRQNEIEEMFSSCIPYLLQNEYADPVYCFPTAIDVQPKEDKEEKVFSRLGWCYGDLSMANALIHCGRALKKKELHAKGIEVALKTTKRTFENAGCVDAPFCHGSVGLVHQYLRLYHLTQNENFKMAADYWMNITQQQFYKAGEGAGGYYSREFNEEKNEFEFETKFGLLEGSAGIALVYLSYLYDIKPDWDIIFLTNV